MRKGRAKSYSFIEGASLSPLAPPVLRGVPSLVQVDVIERRLDVRPVFAMDLRQPFPHGRRPVVIPAPFAHELVPDLDLLVIGMPPPLEAPIQQVLIRPALLHPFHHRGVIDVQERQRTRVETLPQIRVIVLRQLPRRVQPDFVEHAAQVINATDFIITTSQAGNMHSRCIRPRARLLKRRCAEYA